MSDSALFPIMAIGYEARQAVAIFRAAGIGMIVIGLPWAMIQPHEAQARSNHGGQTLKRLAERGGLGPSEALAVLDNRRWERMPEVEAMAELARRLADFTAQKDPSHAR